MYRGRFQQGQTLGMLLVTTDASSTPQKPDRPPVLKIWQGATLVLSAEVPMIDRATDLGHFLARVFLGNSFPAASYEVTFQWQVGSYAGMQTDNFDVVPGGSPDGNIMAMYFYRRPHANFVIQSLESGRIIEGRNPVV